MTTFIFGHKNPDTDSVCSAIALSYLKNELGSKTVPRVLGHINNETKFVLDYFGVQEPSYLNDVRIRIKNIKYDKKAFIHENASIDQAFQLMQKQHTTAIPLVDDNKMLTGYVTLKEIAKFLITDNNNTINTTLKHIVESLEANIITKFDDYITGDIKIAGLQSKTLQKEIGLDESDILIVGDRYKILEYAIEKHVKLIIIPKNASIDKRIIKRAEKEKVSIIATELGSYEIANKIVLCNYVHVININKTPITVNTEEYFTDFKSMTHQVNHSNYPVVNNKGECLGLIKITGPNNYEAQKVILVDHNNFNQSVDGIEEADILEIIDHHNLGSIGTTIPINFRSKPVGSTCTMIYDLYIENKIAIPKHIAGLMLSAILSDTLVLTSPTTTEDDKFAAIKLAKIAKVDIDKYGYEMLKAASTIKDMSIDDIITNDFKKYQVNNRVLGISQIMTMDFDIIEENLSDYVTRLDKLAMDEYSVIAIFVTDIIKKGSYIIYNTDAESTIKDAFGLKHIRQGIFIPKVVSRKKQMLPSIMSIMDSNNN